ncbi:MAG: hypothetical protein ACLUIQ_11580 [Dialister invisus]
MNAIAEAVEGSPTAIDTFAYRYTRTPPQLTHPRDNDRAAATISAASPQPEACPGAYANAGIGVVDTPALSRYQGLATIAESAYLGLCGEFCPLSGAHANVHVQGQCEFFKAHNVIGVYQARRMDGATWPS